MNRKLFVANHNKLVGNSKNLPLAVDNNGNMAPLLNVDLDSFPVDKHGKDIALRSDALELNWLEMSPYWRESYRLRVDEKLVVRYEGGDYKIEVTNNDGRPVTLKPNLNLDNAIYWAKRILDMNEGAWITEQNK